MKAAGNFRNDVESSSNQYVREVHLITSSRCALSLYISIPGIFDSGH